MKIFFSGIGGSGVSAIAGFSAEKGHSVTGSDRLFDVNPSHPLKRTLTANGISIVPQNGEAFDRSFDLAIFSTAVENRNPDILRANDAGIPVRTRPQYLTELIAGYRTIAVAGTSGKSTTAGMLAFVMKSLGMEPNLIGGARVKQFRTEKNPGNYAVGSSDILIVEACESDGSIAEYYPVYSIISNLAFDHHTVEETSRMFKKLASHSSGFVLTGNDDKNLASFSIKSPFGFSIEAESKYRAVDIEYQRLKTAFSVRGQRFEISLPGTYNLYNALACIACLSELGAPPDKVAEALSEFTGIERRFDIHLDNGRYLVIDDYAHNPHKILSLMQTVQKISRSVCYIFQPHGYGPARLMKKGYVEVFSNNLRETDHLILLPIYYAGGTATKDISSEDIAGAVRSAGKSTAVLHERSSIDGFLGRWDSYVVFGARDDSLSEFAGEIARRLK